MEYQKNRAILLWLADEHFNQENSLVGVQIPRLE